MPEEPLPNEKKTADTQKIIFIETYSRHHITNQKNQERF